MDDSPNNASSLVNITTQLYFEYVIYFFGWVFLLIGFPLIIIKWYVGILTLLLGVIIITTSYRLKVDLTKNQIEEFFFILGMKKNSTTKNFLNLNYIFIKEGSYTQQLHLKSLSSTIRGIVYSAYLATDEGKYFLGESKSKSKLQKKAHHIGNQLKLEVREVH